MGRRVSAEFRLRFALAAPPSLRDTSPFVMGRKALSAPNPQGSQARRRVGP